jgi:hypothetical protein
MNVIDEPRELDSGAMGIGRKVEVEREDHRCAYGNVLVSKSSGVL